MASKCFMCGAAISEGILCEKCDKPRKPKAKTESGTTAVPNVGPSPGASRHPLPASRGEGSAAQATAPAVAPDAFPKAPVVPFPVESASLAITSVANVLIAAGVASIVLGPDRGVKFVTSQAKKLFGVAQSDLGTVKQIEALAGLHIGELSVPATSALHIGNQNIIYSLVPLSGGASGAVLVFRPADSASESHASFVAFVRETVLMPMRFLRDSMIAASRKRNSDPLLDDAAGTIDQVLSSLEMAPEVEEPAPETRIPKVVDVVHTVANRFQQFADLKGIHLQVDVPDLEERFRNHDQLADTLGILMDNSLHYVPAGGQVVVGVRWMEHKGRPLLLFFVMDNGPVVPEDLRAAIFEPSFVWNPNAAERTGRGLFKVREFAVAHSGSVWVESKTGKACTFFLRVRPDSAR
ncbi:MAG TPA: HAMP domain-containing sensor histidine kinase [Thermoanaerobaculia bacterium]|jgi:signal transduction histidine kinase